MPSTVEPAMRSCDSSPLMLADDSDDEQRTIIIGSPVSQLLDDNITQYSSLSVYPCVISFHLLWSREIDHTLVDISSSQDSDHRYDNTDKQGERIQR